MNATNDSKEMETGKVKLDLTRSGFHAVSLLPSELSNWLHQCELSVSIRARSVCVLKLPRVVNTQVRFFSLLELVLRRIMFSTAANRYAALTLLSFVLFFGRTLDVCFCGLTTVISRMLVWLMSIA